MYAQDQNDQRMNCAQRQSHDVGVSLNFSIIEAEIIYSSEYSLGLSIIKVTSNQQYYCLHWR